MKQFLYFLMTVTLSAVAALTLQQYLNVPTLGLSELSTEPYPTETLIYYILISTFSLFFYSLFYQLNGEIVDAIYYSCGIFLIAVVYISSASDRVTLAQVNAAHAR